jgi:nucleoside 2-deoxyribosyltransferase
MGWRMKIYLAGRYDRRVELLGYAGQLGRRHLSTARWLTGAHEGATDPETLLRCAKEDMEDIERSDVLVVFTEDPSVGQTSGGRHVEMGFAMGIDVDVVVVGPIENVFHHLVDADGSRYDTWAEALAEEFA